MKLIIIIPAFNEEKTIQDVIKEIPRQIDKIDEVNVFVINDGSSDKTAENAKKAGADKIINNPKNMGLAKTFQIGILEALKNGADIIVNTDADGQYDQKEIPKLIKPILEKKTEMVIGDRQVKKLKFMKAGNRYGNLLGSWGLRLLTKSKINDASSGFRAFSRECALRLNINFAHTYTHETIIQSAFRNMRVKEVPIEFRPRIAGKSKLIQNIFTHIKKSSLVILRSILLYKPLRFMFYFGLLIMLPGIFLGLRFVYYFLHSSGDGKIQSLILASIFIIIGFFVIMFGILGDLIANNRRLNEDILFELKNEKFSKKDIK